MRKLFHRDSKILPGLLLAAMTFIAYANSLPNGFHFDDYHAIVQNPAIRDLSHIPSYFTDPSTWTMSTRRDWRPVVQISYAINYFISGLNPAGFRLFNLLFHTGTALFILLIFSKIFRLSSADRSPSSKSINWLALFPAGLFAVHTVNTEAVNYIWVRSSLLASFFYLLAFYCFLRGPFSGQKKPLGLWHAAGVASFSLGLASKAIAITLPLTLIFYELLFLNPEWRNPFRLYRQEPWRLKKYIPMALVCFAYIVLRIVLLPRSMTILVTAREVTPSTYLLTQFRAWVYYLRLFLWPDPLIVDYPGFGWSRSLWDYRVLLSIGLIALILSFAWRCRKSEPIMAFFTFWFFIALLPEASIIPLSDPVNGYRPYLANAGLSIVAAMGILKATEWSGRKINWARGGILYTLVAGIILSLLTVATVKRNRVWRNEFTLWSDVLKKDPTNARAYMSLGLYSLKGGNYQEAQELLEKAVQLSPNNAFAYILRGYFNALFERNTRASEDFTQAIKLEPRLPYGFYYRGELYRKMGEYEKALADYHSAIRLRPLYTEAHFGMATVFRIKGESGKAIEACEKLLAIDPYDPRGYSCLGSLLMEQNRTSEALKSYEIGVKRAPQDSELWYQLGLVYEKLGMYLEAAEAFGKASALTGRGLTPETGKIS